MLTKLVLAIEHGSNLQPNLTKFRKQISPVFGGLLSASVTIKLAALLYTPHLKVLRNKSDKSELRRF